MVLERQRVFESELTAAGAARRFVCDTLRSWALPEGDLPLLASELAANAIVHARGDFEVRMVLHDHVVRIEVIDQDPRLPMARATQPDADRGRGLFLIKALSQDWGVEARSQGKAVWFEVSRPDHLEDGTVGRPTTI